MPMRIYIGKSTPAQDELGGVPLFEGLEHARRAGLAGLMDDESHKRGDVIFNQGDYGDALYVIKRVRRQILVLDVDGLNDLAE